MSHNLCNTKTTCLVLLAIGLCLQANSQQQRTGTINLLNAQLNFNSKFSAFFEGQLRSEGLYKNFTYDDFKVGIGYNIDKKVAVAVGNGFHNTYTGEGNFKKPLFNHEYRLWEQLILYNSIGRLKIEHRYRVEQRWLTQGYRNRFRYRLNAIVTLNNDKLEKGTLYAYANNEIYLTDKAPYFQRNRMFVGMGYRFIKQLVVQVGYLHQSDYIAGKTTPKNYLQTALLITVHSHRSIRELHPATLD